MFPLKLRGGLPWIKGQKEVTLWEGLSPPVPEFTGCLNHPDKTQKRDHSYPKVTTYQYRKAVDLSGRGIIVVFSKYRSIASCLYATKSKSSQMWSEEKLWDFGYMGSQCLVILKRLVFFVLPQLQTRPSSLWSASNQEIPCCWSGGEGGGLQRLLQATM